MQIPAYIDLQRVFMGIRVYLDIVFFWGMDTHHASCLYYLSILGMHSLHIQAPFEEVFESPFTSPEAQGF